MSEMRGGGCGKTVPAQQSYKGRHVWDKRRIHTYRMLKQARFLTRPAPARQDAPFRGQDRSKRRGEATACFSILRKERAR